MNLDTSRRPRGPRTPCWRGLGGTDDLRRTAAGRRRRQRRLPRRSRPARRRPARPARGEREPRPSPSAVAAGRGRPPPLPGRRHRALVRHPRGAGRPAGPGMQPERRGRAKRLGDDDGRSRRPRARTEEARWLDDLEAFLAAASVPVAENPVGPILAILALRLLSTLDPERAMCGWRSSHPSPAPSNPTPRRGRARTRWPRRSTGPPTVGSSSRPDPRGLARERPRSRGRGSGGGPRGAHARCGLRRVDRGRLAGGPALAGRDLVHEDELAIPVAIAPTGRGTTW